MALSDREAEVEDLVAEARKIYAEHPNLAFSLIIDAIEKQSVEIQKLKKKL